MTGDELVLFQLISNKPMPYLPDQGEKADGEKILTLQQCVERFGQAADFWRNEWTQLYGRWLPKLESGDVAPVSAAGVAVAQQRIKSSAIHAARFPNLSREQFEYVESVANLCGLPADQMYAKLEPDGEKTQVVLIMSIHMIRAQAERTGTKGRETQPEFCDESGNWTPAPWLKEEPPVAARVRVVRTDTGVEEEGVAYFSQCAQWETSGGKAMHRQEAATNPAMLLSYT